MSVISAAAWDMIWQVCNLMCHLITVNICAGQSLLITERLLCSLSCAVFLIRFSIKVSTLLVNSLSSIFMFSGIIKTALLNMDRENREQYQVVIQAKDMGGQMGGLSGTTTVNITLTDVNDNPPRFPQSMEYLCYMSLQ